MPKYKITIFVEIDDSDWDDEYKTEDDYYDYLFEDVTAHADDYINDDATIIERID